MAVIRPAAKRICCHSELRFVPGGTSIVCLRTMKLPFHLPDRSTYHAGEWGESSWYVDQRDPEPLTVFQQHRCGI